MKNEIRYYLESMLAIMREQDENGVCFTPQYFITAVRLPNGGIELAINTDNIVSKIEYILEACDEEMRLKTNPDVMMCNLMVV